MIIHSGPLEREYMEECKVLKIDKLGKTIKYKVEVSEKLKKYFTKQELVIEYPEKIEDVPDSIAVVPLVCNLLPIIWLTNSKLVVEEIDKSFYECIPYVKKGYEKIYPESFFAGEIIASQIIQCEHNTNNECAMFYSGGVDSVQTFVSHVDEKPRLISIWGSDIKYDNAEGWKKVHASIEDVAKKYELDDAVIRSSFREFDNEWKLECEFSKVLKDGWWHGIKHALALLGHVAPYAYLHGIKKMYIASSYCPDDENIRCASNPITDNCVRFAECQVIHDGYEYNRQEKIYNITKYCSEKKEYIPVHVCWESQEGSNCCHCEKCYRTMVALMVEGENPELYGFKNAKKYIKGMKSNIAIYGQTRNLEFWPYIQKRLFQNQATIQETKYWSNLKWMLKIDFKNPSTLKVPLTYRLKKLISRSLIYSIFIKYNKMLKKIIKRIIK